MHKDFITLEGIQNYVKSKGENDFPNAKEFLTSVFNIGFVHEYNDIFPMKDFDYGDFLRLDKDFLYKEFLKFLEKNQLIDNVLFEIAENEYETFFNEISYGLKNLDQFETFFKTKKENIEIEKKSKIETLSSLIEEFNKDDTENEKNEKKIASKDLDQDMKDFRMAANMSFMYDTSYEDYSNELPEQKFKDKIYIKLGMKINYTLVYNFYARMRIEEYLKDIEKLKGYTSNVFKLI